MAGRYAGSFRPVLAGAYQVKYTLKFPDGESLERENFLRVSEAGEEAIDVSFARLDLEMLAKLTGGQYLSVDQMNSNWDPTFAEDLPSVRKRHSLSNAWIVFILLFLLQYVLVLVLILVLHFLLQCILVLVLVLVLHFLLQCVLVLVLIQ